MNFYREKALENFRKLGFFTYLDNKHIDIIAFFSKKKIKLVDLLKKKIDSDIIFRYNFFYLNSFIQHFMVNGYYLDHKIKKNEENFFSGSLNTFASQYPKIFLQYYNQQSNSKGDGLSAFNTMFIQDGYVLYIPKNVVVEKPIQLTNILNGKIDSLINRRILIILEQNAQAKLLICDHSIDVKTSFAFIQIAEIYLEEHAVFDFYELEKNTKKTIRLTQNFVCQMKSSKLVTNTVTLSNGITLNKYLIDLNQKNAEANVNGLSILDKKQQINNFTIIRHNTSECCSNVLHKYLLDGESIGSFVGKIIVASNAYKTKSFQKNCNILNSNTCKIYSNPQLEIYTDNVKCSHGVSTGHLNEAALFYMRSRGISNKKSRYLLKLAFTTDILQKIYIEDLKEKLQLLVERKLKKN